MVPFAKPQILFANFNAKIQIVYVLRRPMRAALLGAALGCAMLPAFGQTVIDYTNGQTRNVGIFTPGPGTLTLNTGAGVTAIDASTFAGATGDVTKTGAGRLSITADNGGGFSAGAGNWVFTNLRVAEGKLDVANSIAGGSSLGRTFVQPNRVVQIDAGATLVTDTSEANYGRFTGAGILALRSAGTMIGANTSTLSGHIGAHIVASDTTATATNRAAVSGFASLYIVDGHRLNFSGTSSDVMFDMGVSGTSASAGATVALNGAVLGEVINRTGRGLPYGDLQALRLTRTTDTALIEGSSSVASLQSKGTVDLGGNTLTLFDNQAAINGNLVTSEMGVAGEGVLKGGAASVLRKTGQSKLNFNLGDSSGFLGRIEVDGGDVTITKAVLADDNALVVTGEK